MARRRKSRALGEYSFSSSARGRVSHGLIVSVKVSRGHGDFRALACIRGKHGFTAITSRCGSGSGPSPKRAISWALADLAKKARR